MSYTGHAPLVSYDADGALEAATEAIDDETTMLAAAAFTRESYELLSVSGELLERYGTRETVEEINERLHNYIKLDLTERELFDDLIPAVEETRALVTHTDTSVIVRILAEDEGLYLSFLPGVDTGAVIEAVWPIVTGEDYT